MEKGNRNVTLLIVMSVATMLIALVGATFAYFSATINAPEGNQSVVVETVTLASLEYVATTPLTLPSAMPGQSDDATFTVTNPAKITGTDEDNTVSQLYDVNLVVLVNGFSSEADDVKDTNKEADRTKQLLMKVTGSTKNTLTDGATNTVKVPQLQKANLSLYGSETTQEVEYTFDLTDGSEGSTFAGDADPVSIVKDQEIAPGEVHTYTVDVNFYNFAVSQNANQGQTFSAYIEVVNPRTV